MPETGLLQTGCHAAEKATVETVVCVTPLACWLKIFFGRDEMASPVYPFHTRFIPLVPNPVFIPQFRTCFIPASHPFHRVRPLAAVSYLTSPQRGFGKGGLH